MISVHRLFEPLFHSHICHYPLKTVVLRVGIETLVLAAVAFAAMTSIAQAAPISTETPTISPAPISALPSNVAQPTPTTPETNTVSVQATVRPPVPACSKGAIPSPSQIPLNAQQSGVIRVVDAPQYYTVYGNSLAEARNQIAKCSPIEKGRYAAVTVSTINWQFSYNRDSLTNACKITTAAVGVHTGFLYPNWNTPTAQWSSFMSNLKVHEQGHADLDATAANSILIDLQTLPPTDCGTIVATANALASSRIAVLEHANHAYDSRTNHGTTQGASL